MRSWLIGLILYDGARKCVKKAQLRLLDFVALFCIWIKIMLAQARNVEESSKAFSDTL